MDLANAVVRVWVERHGHLIGLHTLCVGVGP